MIMKASGKNLDSHSPSRPSAPEWTGEGPVQPPTDRSEAEQGPRELQTTEEIAKSNEWQGEFHFNLNFFNSTFCFLYFKKLKHS